MDLKELTGELVEKGLGLGRLGGLEAGLADFAGGEGKPGRKGGVEGYEVVNGIGGQRVRNYLDAFQAVVQVKPGDADGNIRACRRGRGAILF